MLWAAHPPSHVIAFGWMCTYYLNQPNLHGLFVNASVISCVLSDNWQVQLEDQLMEKQSGKDTIRPGLISAGLSSPQYGSLAGAIACEHWHRWKVCCLEAYLTGLHPFPLQIQSELGTEQVRRAFSSLRRPCAASMDLRRPSEALKHHFPFSGTF